jgi:DNA repair protein RadC
MKHLQLHGRAPGAIAPAIVPALCPRGDVSESHVDASLGARVPESMAIEQWPASERPRERLYWSGAGALADAELLALQLGSGRRGQTAVEVAREMLASYGSLAGVAARDLAELARRPGVGRAKAARLVSAFELTRRLRARTPGARIVLGSPAEVHAAFGPLMEDLQREVFRIALLDAQNTLLRDLIISEGTLSASLVHPREVFKPALLEPAVSIILLHNHPSGDPTPSREDVKLTRQLAECARLLELRIHDHLVIGQGRYVSLAERGII